MGIKDLQRVHSTEDLAPAERIVLVATGVTQGALLKGFAYLGMDFGPIRWSI
jgi:fructose-1,6-bisphosphatase/sedoheptulose 1,7-bisphosphatase-like protein